MAHAFMRIPSLRAAARIQLRWSGTASMKRAGDLAVDLQNGRPAISVPLPAAGTTVFTLNAAQPVWRLLQDLRAEDSSVTSAKAFDASGAALADSTPLSAALQGRFQLAVNDALYTVEPSAAVAAAGGAGAAAPELRDLVEQLYASLRTRDAVRADLVAAEGHLAALKAELAPLEEKRQQCEAKARRATSIAAWGGLTFLSVQWGALWHLTYAAFSWDLTEPAAYFLGSGTSILFGAYYILNRREHSYEVLGEYKHLRTLHKHAKRAGLDVDKYNSLQTQIHDTEQRIKALSHQL